MAQVYKVMAGGCSPLQAQNTAGTVTTGLTATGTSSQANALPVSDDFNRVDTTPANSGVILATLGFWSVGDALAVQNNTATNALLVYPPVGGYINLLSQNTGFSVATGKTAVFVCTKGGSTPTFSTILSA